LISGPDNTWGARAGRAPRARGADHGDRRDRRDHPADNVHTVHTADTVHNVHTVHTVHTAHTADTVHTVHSDHRIGVDRGAMVLLFIAFAVYAAVFALVSHGAESDWGAWGAGAYGLAAVLAGVCWRRYPGIPLIVALVGAFAVPAALLPDNLGPTSEVRVVARAASLWLAHGTPYLASGQLVSWRSYDPYLPGMSLFGLPRALGLHGSPGDPLFWLAIATIALLYAAFRIAAPDAAPPCAGCRRQALLRALLLLSTPVFAFPMALGVTDPPVIGLICVGLAWAATSRRPPASSGLPSGARPVGEAGRSGATSTWRPRDALLAGLAIGAACALKATAWPAFPIVFVLIFARDGRRAAASFASSSLGIFVALTAVTAPKLLAQPGALWQNLVAYPLGLSHRVTPAASPLPGHVLAESGSAGHLAAIGLLGAAALAVLLSLVFRPPRDIAAATFRLAIGFAAMFLLAPDTRFGYFAYPVGTLCWLALAVGIRRRAEFHPIRRGRRLALVRGP
jgi:hypothetical protein